MKRSNLDPNLKMQIKLRYWYIWVLPKKMFGNWSMLMIEEMDIFFPGHSD